MAIFYSDLAQGLTPAATAAAGAPTGNTPAVTAYGANDIVSVRAKVSLPVTLTTADTAVMCLLPAGHVPIDAMAIFDDLDDGASLTVSLNVLDDTLAASVATTDFFTAESTAPRAGGVARANVKAGLVLAGSLLDRWIGLNIIAGTASQKAGDVTVVFTYRAGQTTGL